MLRLRRVPLRRLALPCATGAASATTSAAGPVSTSAPPALPGDTLLLRSTWSRWPMRRSEHAVGVTTPGSGMGPATRCC